LGILLAAIVPASYRAEARLLTLYAGYYDMQLDKTDAKAGPSLEPGQIVSVEAQILTSPELHRAIVQDELGPAADPAAIERALRQFESNLKIEKVETANVIQLSFSDSDPRRAAKYLEKLIAQYFRQRAGVFTTGRVGFLVEQRDKIRTQLDKANAELIAFQRSHNIVNIEAQINSTVTLNAFLLQRKFENESTFSQDESTLDSLKSEALSVPATIKLYEDNTEAAHAIDTMQLSLLQLQGRKGDLASRYMADSPFVQQIDQQITEMKKSIDQQRSVVVNATRTGHNTYFDTVQDRIVRLTSDVAGEVARKETLESQIKDADSQLQFLIATANQLRRMEIDRDLLVDSFKNFSREVEAARIEQNQVDTSSSTNVRIIQAPFPPDQRNNPPILFIAASLLVGLLAAALLIIFRVSLRETFLSPEEIERSLGLSVLSAPIHPDVREKRLMQLAAPALIKMLPLLSRWFSAPTAGATDKLPALSRRLPTEFGQMISAINNSSENPSKIVLMLAFRDDDGIDSVVRGLVEGLERRSTRPVLILDLTSDGQLFGQPDEDGLLQWPGGENTAPSWRHSVSRPGSAIEAEKVFTFAAVEKRHLVVGRRRPDAFLPVGRQSSETFDALRQAHDYIVLCVPSASRSFAGIETAILADATVIAVRAESTRKPIILNLKSQILDAGGSIVGVAMTHRVSYIPAFVYRFL